MPRKVTAWACKFRCGRKTDTVKKRMVEHEERCRMNPARHACPTCKNWLFEWEEDCSLACGEIVYSSPYKVRYCDIDKNPQVYLSDKDRQGESPFVYNCDNWEQKPEEY